MAAGAIRYGVKMSSNYYDRYPPAELSDPSYSCKISYKHLGSVLEQTLRLFEDNPTSQFIAEMRENSVHSILSREDLNSSLFKLFPLEKASSASLEEECQRFESSTDKASAQQLIALSYEIKVLRSMTQRDLYNILGIILTGDPVVLEDYLNLTESTMMSVYEHIMSVSKETDEFGGLPIPAVVYLLSATGITLG